MFSFLFQSFLILFSACYLLWVSNSRIGLPHHGQHFHGFAPCEPSMNCWTEDFFLHVPHCHTSTPSSPYTRYTSLPIPFDIPKFPFEHTPTGIDRYSLGSSLNLMMMLPLSVGLVGACRGQKYILPQPLLALRHGIHPHHIQRLQSCLYGFSVIMFVSRLNTPDRARSGICGLKGRCPNQLDDRGKGSWVSRTTTPC